MTNIITVDVEDWYQAFEHIAFPDWPKFESRTVKNVSRLLSILRSFKIKATFFFLGYEAERHPELVRDVFREGHEIATHGYSHKLIYRMGRDEFRQELRKSIGILESITGEKVLGHRAPAWSITKDCLWALDILLEEDLKYDSSISPWKSYLYGMPGARRFPGIIRQDHANKLIEFPMSTVRILGNNLPFIGGFFTRAVPYRLMKTLIRKLNNSAHPVMLLVHPWDLDIDQPRIEAPLYLRRHYYGLKSLEIKLRKLLSDFQFAPLREKISAYA